MAVSLHLTLDSPVKPGNDKREKDTLQQKEKGNTSMWRIKKETGSPAYAGDDNRSAGMTIVEVWR